MEQQVLLAPIGDGVNFTTVEWGTNLAIVQQLVPPDLFQQVAELSTIGTWGVATSRPNGDGKGLINCLRGGDTVLFCADHTICAIAGLIYATRNPGIAAQLWEGKPDGRQWQDILVLDLQQLDLAISLDLSAILEYDPKAILHYPVLLAGEEARYMLAYLDHQLTTIPPSETQLQEIGKFLAWTGGEVADIAAQLFELTKALLALPLSFRLSAKVHRMIERSTLAQVVLCAQHFVCQVCGQPPFKTTSGRWYAEAHHITPRSMGGSDDDWNLICLCPRCHRITHYGVPGLLTAVATQRWLGSPARWVRLRNAERIEMAIHRAH